MKLNDEFVRCLAKDLNGRRQDAPSAKRRYHLDPISGYPVLVPKACLVKRRL